MIHLERSKIGRMVGSRSDAIALFNEAQRELPFNGHYFRDDDGTEHWVMEKQFWLKNKKTFQGVGFLPSRTWNTDKNTLQMLENFKVEEA